MCSARAFSGRCRDFLKGITFVLVLNKLPLCTTMLTLLAAQVRDNCLSIDSHYTLVVVSPFVGDSQSKASTCFLHT